METNKYVNPISIALLFILGGAFIALYVFQIISIPVLVGGILLTIFIARSIRIADQWEKAVV